MVGMKMADRDVIELIEAGAGFAETQKGTAARIDHDARAAILPDDIGR